MWSFVVAYGVDLGLTLIMDRVLRWTRDDAAAGDSGGAAHRKSCSGGLHLVLRSSLDRSRLGCYAREKKSLSQPVGP